MERVPEVLQFPIIVQGRRPLAFEPQLLEKRHFLRRRRAAEGRIVKEPLEPGLFDELLFRFQLDKLKLLHVSGDQSVVQDDFQGKRGEVDVPGCNQRIQERDAVFNGYVEDVGIEERENDAAHLLVAAAAQLRHCPQPRFVLQFLLGQSLDHVQQLLGDQAFQLSEGLLLEDRAYLSCRVGLALPEDQLANFPKQRRGLVPQLSLQLLLALMVRQPRQFPVRKLQELVHLVVDVGAVRRGGRSLPREQLGDVGLGHLGGVGEIALLQPEFLQPAPDHERDIHGIPPWASLSLDQEKLTSARYFAKVGAVLDMYSTSVAYFGIEPFGNYRGSGMVPVLVTGE